MVGDEGGRSRRAWMHQCERYLAARTGCYQWRRTRYQRAAERLAAGGLSDADTLVDVGAGWTELDYYLRRELDWRGPYLPVDGAIDGSTSTTGPHHATRAGTWRWS